MGSDYQYFRRCTGVLICAGLLVAAPALANSKQQKAKGAALFAEKGCAHCHGPSGFGGSDSGPDLSDVRKQLKPAAIAHQIRGGGKNMPPFGNELSEDQIASLVAYLHSRRKPPPGWMKNKPASSAPGAASKSDPD